MRLIGHRPLRGVLGALVLAFSACTGTPRDASPGVFAQPGTKPDPESIGSLRNARVAFPDARETTLTILTGPLPAAELEELKRLAPNVTILHGLSREQAMTHAGDAHAIDARFATPEFLAKAPKLVWVMAMSAGVDHLIGMEALARNQRVVLTNMRAVHGPAIADHAFAMLLSQTRNLRAYAEHQAAGKWSRESGEATPRSSSLAGRTMLVVGLGGIGGEIAQRAHGFDMRVTAIRRSDTPAPDYVARLGHAADLVEMLKEADVVAICLPLTPETEGIFDAEAFAAMKPGAYLINIARGPIVDTPSLLGALESGRLGGACLDVTDPEPLPPEHPLWKHPRVLITPHVAADAEITSERRNAVLRENIRRFGAGEPLLNVVDMKAGY